MDTKDEVLKVAVALYETVREAGEQGAPSGPMYAAVMGLVSLDQYEAIMNVFVRAGKIRKSNHCYFIN